jgi:hypothetical protein
MLALEWAGCTYKYTCGVVPSQPQFLLIGVDELIVCECKLIRRSHGQPSGIGPEEE